MYEVEIAFLIDDVTLMRKKLLASKAKLNSKYNKVTIYYTPKNRKQGDLRLKIYSNKIVLMSKGGVVGDVSRKEIEQEIKDIKTTHEKILRENDIDMIEVIKWKEEIYEKDNLRISLEPSCEGGFWKKASIEIEKVIRSKKDERDALREIKSFASKLGLKTSVTHKDVIAREIERKKEYPKFEIPNFKELTRFVKSN
jgi:predicted adenylyl cyclase CyaB